MGSKFIVQLEVKIWTLDTLLLTSFWMPGMHAFMCLNNCMKSLEFFSLQDIQVFTVHVITSPQVMVSSLMMILPYTGHNKLRSLGSS